jgi:DNA-binding CsgD family transcriptional regulator
MNQLKEHLPTEIFELVKDKEYDITYLLDLKTDKYIYISQTEKLLGYSTEKFYEGGSDFTISLIYSEDYQRALLHFASIMQDASMLKRTIFKGIKFRMRHANGNLIWVKRTVIFYEEDKKYKVLGLVNETTYDLDKEQFLIGQIDKSPALLKNLSYAVEEISEKYECERDKLCKKITRSELAILKLIASDFSSKMIASALGISKSTVETHRKNLHRKFEVHSTGALIGKAGELGLIGLGMIVNKNNDRD